MCLIVPCAGCPRLLSRSAPAFVDQVDALDYAPFFSRQIFSGICPYERSLDNILGSLVKGQGRQKQPDEKTMALRQGVNIFLYKHLCILLFPPCCV
jgi:hypothetical protein